MIKPKKCKDDEILNPASNRCVKRSGAIGKRLLANKSPKNAPKKELKKCKDEEILNPKTNRCVSKTGKIGKALVAQAKEEQRANNPITNNVIAQMEQELKKGKQVVTFKLEIVKSGPHSLEITKRTTKRIESYVLHKVLDKYKHEYEKVASIGYVQSKLTGSSYAEILDIIKSNNICKITNQTKSKSSNTFNVSKCVNDSTIVMFEPLSSVPKENIINFDDGYCFEINEIAEYIIAAESFVNPLTKEGLNKNDIEKMMKHRNLDKQNLTKLKQLQSKNEDKVKDIQAFYKKNPKLVELILELLLLTGLQCTCDYSKEFFDSQSALGITFETIDKKMDEPTKKVLLELASPGVNLNLAYIVRNYNSVCIHGIGYNLTEIALYNIFQLKCEHIIPRDLLYHPSNTRMVIQVVKRDAYRNLLHVYYDQDIQKQLFLKYFVRIGDLMTNRDYVQYFNEGMFGMTWANPTAFVEENVMPYIGDVLRTTTKCFSTKKNLQTIEKVAKKISSQ